MKAKNERTVSGATEGIRWRLVERRWRGAPAPRVKIDSKGRASYTSREEQEAYMREQAVLSALPRAWFCGYVTLPAGHPWETPDEAALPFGGVTYHDVNRDGDLTLGFDTMGAYHSSTTWDEALEALETLASEAAFAQRPWTADA